jgi:hypothetical protein
LPSPFEPLENLTAKFVSKGLEKKDVAVLSGLLPSQLLHPILNINKKLLFRFIE